jgi:S-adenosyl-L-methionine hydrolase (adenosine-forming)
MIVLYTDFGVGGPYVGQVHAVLAQQAPGSVILDLFNDLPSHDIRAAAYLLPAYTQGFPPETVFLCVVDPGVGGTRRALVVRADQRWYVGPDNGLFHVLARRAQSLECHEIRWQPAHLSPTFHGRDLFAPVAAQLARGRIPESMPAELAASLPDWPEDLPQVLYIDRFGNAITGLRAARLGDSARLQVGAATLAHARTYAEVGTGDGFWYENANGLAEIAVNQGRASEKFDISVGSRLNIIFD